MSYKLNRNNDDGGLLGSFIINFIFEVYLLICIHSLYRKFLEEKLPTTVVSYGYPQQGFPQQVYQPGMTQPNPQQGYQPGMQQGYQPGMQQIYPNVAEMNKDPERV